ncbi:hypothetical protein V8D89_005098 [Ganoderma adspersum]
MAWSALSTMSLSYRLVSLICEAKSVDFNAGNNCEMACCTTPGTHGAYGEEGGGIDAGIEPFWRAGGSYVGLRVALCK